MSLKYFVSIFAALLIGVSVSSSYSGETIFCNGLESCPTNDGDAILALQNEVNALKVLLADVSRGTDPNTGQDTLTFTGMNVQVVSGSGTTSGIKNGTGNLIVGYNELRGANDNRTGSHMLVIGHRNNYSEYGGMVVGSFNTASGFFSSVSGGDSNTASGQSSSVSGGSANTAGASWTSVSGGSGRNAAALYCWEGGATVDC